MVQKAIDFATKVHEGQYRKGTDRPYIVHPMEVGKIVSTMTQDEEIISAAILHDTIEDCEGVDANVLKEMFSARVAGIVSQESEDKDVYKRQVLLCVTGGIAAYKIATLASMLVKTGYDVKVVMTQNATNFINPLVFETLTQHKCLIDTFDRNLEYSVAVSYTHLDVYKRQISL